MSRVTSKYQVSVPKALAEQYGIVPGDHLEWTAAGDTLRVSPPGKRMKPGARPERLRLFDSATERQTKRDKARPLATATERGWTRDELYERE